MNASLHTKLVLFLLMNLTVVIPISSQSNLLPGLLTTGPAYTFLDDEIFGEIPDVLKIPDRNSSFSTESSYSAHAMVLKASKIYVDNSNPLVEFSIIAPWATDYIWKFGDGSVTSGVQNTSHDFKSAGVYNVTVTASNNKQSEKESIEIIVIDNQKGIKLEEMGHFIVFPTDNKLEADIQLDLPTREKKLYVELQDIEGEHIVEVLVGRVRKKQRIKLDFGEVPEGKYYAVLKGKKFSMLSKITVIRN